MTIPRRILPIIVLSQFCCTSLWFASNGVMGDLVGHFGLGPNAVGHLTSAVQFGFISGTLLFALLTVADRYSPSRVFLGSAVLGAAFNLATVADGNSMASLLVLRFMTGFFLAGIYPVGMKIAADYFEAGLGKSLGYLVGALVVGTAFPHLLSSMEGQFSWRMVVAATSVLAVLGGTAMLMLVPDGPFRRPGQGLDLSAFFRVFRDRRFRSAAFGYFGHMWELYAFWAFVPIMLSMYQGRHAGVALPVSTLAFSIIGIGGVACALGGHLSGWLGVKRTATLALASSCMCCLLSPVFFRLGSSTGFVAFLLLWGMVVVADSPLFSTMVARNAIPEAKGTALTIVNCIGFSITIFSIQLLTWLQDRIDPVFIFTLLAIGPMLGLLALFEKRQSVVLADE